MTESRVPYPLALPGVSPARRPLPDGIPLLTPSVVPQRGRARHLREKLAVFGAFAEQALVAEPGFDARPALDLLAAMAGREHPQAFAVQGALWHAPWLGWGLDPDDEPVDHRGGWPEIGPLLMGLPRPWRRAVLLSLAVAEDFAVLDARSRRLCWGAVALPSFWAPEQAVGQALDDHLGGGLPDLGEELLEGRHSPTPRLHAHPRRCPTPDDDTTVWWRVQRSVALPLPDPAQQLLVLRVDTLALP